MTSLRHAQMPFLAIPIGELNLFLVCAPLDPVSRPSSWHIVMPLLQSGLGSERTRFPRRVRSLGKGIHLAADRGHGNSLDIWKFP